MASKKKKTRNLVAVLIHSPQSPIQAVELFDKESKNQSTAFVPRISKTTSEAMESKEDQSSGLRIRGSLNWARARRYEFSMILHVETF